MSNAQSLEAIAKVELLAHSQSHTDGSVRCSAILKQGLLVDGNYTELVVIFVFFFYIVFIAAFQGAVRILMNSLPLAVGSIICT